VRLDEARHWFGCTTDASVRECVAVADELGLLVRSTPGRTTVQWRPKGEKQQRVYALKGYGPSIQVAIDNERRRRKAERVPTRLPPAGRSAKEEGGRLVRIRGLNC
jgi:hypothetical protein